MNIYLDDFERWQLEQRIKNMEKVYDKEETFHGCTVQVLTNTKTGEVSVGWIRPDGTVVDIV